MTKLNDNIFFNVGPTNVGHLFDMYVTSFFSILYWSNCEFCPQKRIQSGKIYSIITVVTIVICPAPFTYSVWQKGYFHPIPLTVGIRNPHISLLSCVFTSFVLLTSHHLLTKDLCIIKNLRMRRSLVKLSGLVKLWQGI